MDDNECLEDKPFSIGLSEVFPEDTVSGQRPGGRKLNPIKIWGKKFLGRGNKYKIPKVEGAWDNETTV